MCFIFLETWILEVIRMESHNIRNHKKRTPFCLCMIIWNFYSYSLGYYFCNFVYVKQRFILQELVSVFLLLLLFGELSQGWSTESIVPDIICCIYTDTEAQKTCPELAILISAQTADINKTTTHIFQLLSLRYAPGILQYATQSRAGLRSSQWMDQNKDGMMGKQVISQNEEGNKAAKTGWKEAQSKWKVWQSSSGAISPQILSTILRDQKHAWKVGICVTSLIWEAVHLSNLYFKLCCPFPGRHHYVSPLAFSSANILLI